MYTNLKNMIYKEKSIINNKSIDRKIRHRMGRLDPDIILNFITPSEYHRFTLIKFYVKAGYALASQSNINAIIGPYGVNVMNLQKKLDPMLELFEKGVQVPIILKVYDFDKYHIIIKFPTLNYFIKSTEESNFLSIYQLYEIMKKKKNDFHLLHIHEKELFFNIIGYLKSGNKSIYYD